MRSRSRSRRRRARLATRHGHVDRRRRRIDRSTPRSCRWDAHAIRGARRSVAASGRAFHGARRTELCMDHAQGVRRSPHVRRARTIGHASANRGVARAANAGALAAGIRFRSHFTALAAWSTDGKLVALLAAAPHGRGMAVVVGNLRTRRTRTITSRYQISMIAWSPVGRRLVYTTSGFPTPHELWLVEGLRGTPRRLLATARHFDWVAWMPGARSLLVDDAAREEWLSVSTSGSRITANRRRGARPLP